MATTMLPCPSDPPSTLANSIVSRRVQFRLSTNSSGASSVSTSLVLSAAGDSFALVRINKISIWGPDAPNTDGSVKSLTVSMPVPSTGGTANSDGASFTDNGTAGAQRASISIRPNFSFRSTWLSSGIDIANIQVGQTTAVEQVVVEISCELR